MEVIIKNLIKRLDMMELQQIFWKVEVLWYGRQRRAGHYSAKAEISELNYEKVEVIIKNLKNCLVMMEL